MRGEVSWRGGGAARSKQVTTRARTFVTQSSLNLNDYLGGLRTAERAGLGARSEAHQGDSTDSSWKELLGREGELYMAEY